MKTSLSFQQETSFLMIFADFQTLDAEPIPPKTIQLPGYPRQEMPYDGIWWHEWPAPGRNRFLQLLSSCGSRDRWAAKVGNEAELGGLLCWRAVMAALKHIFRIIYSGIYSRMGWCQWRSYFSRGLLTTNLWHVSVPNTDIYIYVYIYILVDKPRMGSQTIEESLGYRANNKHRTSTNHRNMGIQPNQKQGYIYCIHIETYV